MAEPAKKDDIDVEIEDDELDLEIIDDTPEEDKGKPVAPLQAEEEVDEETPSEEELKSYSDNVKKRINKLTAQIHAERRAKEQAARQLEEATRFSKNFIDENNRLKDIVNKSGEYFRDSTKGRIESQLNQAKQALKSAYEEGDSEKIVAANEQLAQLHAELDRTKNWRPQPLPRTEYQQPEYDPQSFQPDPKANDWQSRNSWFGQDTAMTATALGVHKDLIDRKGSQYAQTDEYYKEIDREMRKRYPERFEEEPKPNGSTKPTQRDVVVAPAKRSTKKGRKVTLTQSQVALARRLGLTPQQYAEGVLEMEAESE